jgi:putative ABC transport system permease protein
MHTALREFVARLSTLFGRGRRDGELDLEIRVHLELLADDFVRRGMTPEAARRAARREFGGVDQIKERYRDQRGWPALDALWQDARYACVTLRRDPVFCLVAVLTLALGIGATTTIFGGVKAVLLEPLPYADADRVAEVIETNPTGTRNHGTFGMFRGLADRTRSFDAMAVIKPWQPTITGDGQPERLEGQRVSARYFDVLRVPVAAGRAFNAVDDRPGGANVVIMSDALWRRRFGGDPAIVGRRITLDDTAYTVAGIMPSGFENALAPAAEIWAPLQYDMSLGAAWGHHLRTIGRLKPHVSVDAATREIDALGHAVLNDARPASYAPNVALAVNPLVIEMTRAVRPTLLAVLSAVALVLLVACVNVTNLLLARGARRREEFVTRIALGAGRGRLIRLVLVESVVVALAGGALALVTANLGVRALVAVAPPELPRAQGIRVDGIVLAFATALAALSGLVAGLIPALQVSRDASIGAMRSTPRSVTPRLRTRRGLVVAEVALALVLLVSAGLLLRSFQRLFAVSPGFEPSGRVTMQVQAARRFDAVATDRFYQRALDDMRAVPGVERAGLTSQLPLSGDDDEYGARFEGDDPSAGYNIFRYVVSPGYLEAMGIAVRGGRAFDERDARNAPAVALISESLARRRFVGQDPVGRRVHLGPPAAPWYTIVGVAADVRQVSLAVNQPDAVYIPTGQSWFPERSLSFVAKVRGDATSVVPALRHAIWTADKDQPIVRVATLDDLVAASAATRRFALLLFESFAAAALTLAAIGLYGLLSGIVTERHREIGIRGALGASRAAIVALVARQGLVLAGAGVVAGLFAALAASRALATLLFGVTQLDPTTYAASAALLVVVAALACAVPAWRAVRIDPAVALRRE